MYLEPLPGGYQPFTAQTTQYSAASPLTIGLRMWRSAVAGGTVTGMLPHFSTWTIVYDMPAVIIDDGDELPPSWDYVPQHQVRGSQTTTIMAVCAAAVAAIAVAIAAFVVVKKV